MSQTYVTYGNLRKVKHPKSFKYQWCSQDQNLKDKAWTFEAKAKAFKHSARAEMNTAGHLTAS